MPSCVVAEFRDAAHAKAVAVRLEENDTLDVRVRQEGARLLVSGEDPELIWEDIFWHAASGIGGLKHMRILDSETEALPLQWIEAVRV